MKIAILGATGNQGKGLIRALASNPKYHHPPPTIHAITHTPDSPTAQSLQPQFPTLNIKLIQGDVYDAASLCNAFAGADALFAMTHNRIAGKLIETEAEMRHELVAGRNIVDAAKECGIPHVIWSSLPNITEASHGRFDKVFHFDHKYLIEQWAREELPAVTVLYPGLYYSNLSTPQYSRRLEDGTIRFCAPCPSTKPADWVDPSFDIGNYAAEIIHQGPTQTASKTYPVIAPPITFAQMAQEFESVTGIKAVHDPISLDEWGALVAQVAGKGYERDIRQMMEWIAVAPEGKVCYGTMGAPSSGVEGDRAWRELGVRASSFREWLERTGWRGPQ